MKPNKAQYHPDLQPHVAKFSAMPKLFRYPWLVKLIQFGLNLRYRGKSIAGLGCDQVWVPSRSGGPDIRVRVYRPLEQDGDLPAMLYLHGGGYLFGNPEQFAMSIEGFIHTKPCVIIAPDYRKSYTDPYPAGFNDCYDTLLWLRDNAHQLGARADQFILAGHSAGGGLTAALSLKARDTGDVDIAFQMPLYPMIDDRQPHDQSRFMETPVWSSLSNYFGWKHYLAGLHRQGKEITGYAAAARAGDYHNLPPTITFVGQLEPFYQETLSYVASLKEAGIEVLFKEYDGCFHAFDIAVPDTGISQEALAFTYQSFAKFYLRYFE